MIFGVAVVTQEMNKGPRLVYRYPSHRSDYLKSRILALLASTREDGDVRAGIKSNPKTHFVGAVCQQYEGLSDDAFAKLFKEKVSFLGKTSEFSIEDIQFTSYSFPSQQLAVEKDATNTATTANHQHQQHSTASGSANPPPSLVNASNGNGGSARETSTSSASSDVSGQFSSFTIVLLSVNVVSLKAMFPNFTLASHQRHVASPGDEPLGTALFRRPARATGYCAASLKRIVETLSMALAEQEKKSGYVTEQVSLIVQCQEQYARHQRRSVSGNGPSSSLMAPSPTLFKEEFILVPDFDALEEEAAAVAAASAAAAAAAAAANDPAVDVDDSLEETFGTSYPDYPSATGGGSSGGGGRGVTAASSSGSSDDSSSDDDDDDGLGLSYRPRQRVKKPSRHHRHQQQAQQQPSGPCAATTPGGSARRPIRSAHFAPDVAPAASPSSASSSSAMASAAAAATAMSNTAATVAWLEREEARHEVLLHSLLANELRLFFHALTGGRSFHVRLHHTSPIHAKLVSISFVCREPQWCEETALFGTSETEYRRMKPMVVWTSESSTRRARSTLPPAAAAATAAAAVATTGSCAGASVGAGAGAGAARGAIPPPPPPPAPPSSSAAMPLAPAAATHVNFLTVLLLDDADVIVEALSQVSGTSTTTATAATTTTATTAATSDAHHQPPHQPPHQPQSQQPQHQLSNTRIKDFLEHVDPTKSLQDLAVTLDEPVEELVSMAQYLQQLGLAEIVPVIHRRSIFRVHPQAQQHVALCCTSSQVATGNATAAAVIQGAFQAFLTRLAVSTTATVMAATTPMTPPPLTVAGDHHYHAAAATAAATAAAAVAVGPRGVPQLSAPPSSASSAAMGPGGAAGAASAAALAAASSSSSSSVPSMFRGVSLAAVLAAFDGQRTLDEIITHSFAAAANAASAAAAAAAMGGGGSQGSLAATPPGAATLATAATAGAGAGQHSLWPSELRRFLVPTVLFLLRWHLLQLVDVYLLDSRSLGDDIERGLQQIALERRLLSSRGAALATSSSSSASSSSQQQPQAQQAQLSLSSSSSQRVPPLQLSTSGAALSASATATTPLFRSGGALGGGGVGFGGGGLGGSLGGALGGALGGGLGTFGGTGSGLTQYEFALSRALQNELLQQHQQQQQLQLLQQQQQQQQQSSSLSMASSTVASRSLGELAVAWHVPEVDLLRALRLLPHVKLVTKPVLVHAP